MRAADAKQGSAIPGPAGQDATFPAGAVPAVVVPASAALMGGGPSGEERKLCPSMDFFPALPRVMLPFSSAASLHEEAGLGRGTGAAP